jgi:hypothetical protein
VLLTVAYALAPDRVLWEAEAVAAAAEERADADGAEWPEVAAGPAPAVTASKFHGSYTSQLLRIDSVSQLSLSSALPPAPAYRDLSFGLGCNCKGRATCDGA